MLCVPLIVLIGCSSSPEGLTPRETAAALLYITPAATLDINATVTAYAEGIIPSATPSGMYIVKAGDTLSVIADDFSTTVEEIMVANDIASPESIQIGQTLIIPSLVDRTPLPAPTFGPQDTPTIEPTSTPEATPDVAATATP
jgi:LysM repeat protein